LGYLGIFFEKIDFEGNLKFIVALLLALTKPYIPLKDNNF